MTAEPKKTLAQLRDENDRRLRDQLPRLRRAEAPALLAPFARAYLGQFLDLSATPEPAQRVAQLAGPELADAVLDGFVAAARSGTAPSPAAIGRARRQGRDLAEGHVILAGIDRLWRADADIAGEIPDTGLAAAVCLSLTGSSELAQPWVASLMDAHPELVATALNEYWREQFGSGQRYLPGLNLLLEDPANAPVLGKVVLPLLVEWQDCDDRVLRELLFAAMRHAPGALVSHIATVRPYEQELVTVKRRMYWNSAALLLEPERHVARVADYCGQSKERVLPLLDFTSRAIALPAEGGLGMKLPVTLLARLLRIIGPVFPPLEDEGKPVDRISQKVLVLFERFGACTGDDARRERRWLRSVRVMNRCASVLDRFN